MTYEEYRDAIQDVAYLASCAVNGRLPEAERVGKMNTGILYKAADKHLLTGITAMALESAGVKDEAFTQAKGKAIRKAAAFDVERAAILNALEEAGIWYLPLKGCVLKELYPKIGMRQMADNDILYDESGTQELRKIMKSLGFTEGPSFGCGNHDEYFKPPVCNFEMHRSLFGQGSDKRMIEYYKDVKNRLIPDECSSFGFHFNDEDFYIYILAHEYKHYSGGGTGFRSLLDTYVYLKKKGEALDRSYVEAELEKLGIAQFGEQNRSLAMHLFDGEGLTEQDRKMFNYILSSGTYGTVSNHVGNRIDRFGNGSRAKLKYTFSRLFLPMDEVRAYFPLFAKCPLLLPFLPFFRVIRGVTVRRKKFRTEMKAIRNHKRKDNTGEVR